MNWALSVLLDRHKRLLVNEWVLSKSLIPLNLSDPPLLSPLIGPFSCRLPISVLPLPHLVGEVHAREPIHQTILVLEALLSHVECFLHGHREGDAERKDEAGEEKDDVDEVDVMSGSSW